MTSGGFELLDLASLTTIGATTGRERLVLATVDVRDRVSRVSYALRYRVRLVRRDRWYVAAVGAAPSTVMNWVRRAGRAGPRREFSAAEKRRALALVEQSASLRAAGAAVGASQPTVRRWKEHAA